MDSPRVVRIAQEKRAYEENRREQKLECVRRRRAAVIRAKIVQQTLSVCMFGWITTTHRNCGQFQHRRFSARRKVVRDVSLGKVRHSMLHKHQCAHDASSVVYRPHIQLHWSSTFTEWNGCDFSICYGNRFSPAKN